MSNSCKPEDPCDICRNPNAQPMIACECKYCGYKREQYAALNNNVGESIAPRAAVLREAERLITGDRNQTYGSPTQNFQDTAEVWSVLLGHKLKEGERIDPGEVASMMIALKLCRMKAQPKRDNWIDTAGYAACGYEVDIEMGKIND